MGMATKNAKKRPTRAAPGDADFLYNEAVCSSHCSRILNAYDKIVGNEGSAGDFAVLEAYGISVQTKAELIAHKDPLLALCKEWQGSSATSASFFNRLGKGDRLEALLAERLGDRVEFRVL
jgi:hypothetical protein